MFKKYISLILFVSLLFVSSNAIAQPGNNGTPCNSDADCIAIDPDLRCNNGGRCVPVGPGVPVDGGLVLLLAAGVALGMKKLKDTL